MPAPEFGRLPALMVQGTTSDAGKSTLVTALCRILARSGVRVAPFKPQNMALNSAVTVDAGEIGRAQAVQALAAGLQPHTDMNPVLLKPNSDTGAQVIIHGKAIRNMEAGVYHDYKRVAMQAVLQSWQRLQQQYDVLLVEGAGSPAEINLRDRDIANMGFAEAVDCPVILIADIDRGGVFAHLTGTLNLLSASEQERVVGFVINRFRGDIGLLNPGLEWLEKRTGKPVLGVLPYLHGLYLEAEDAVSRSSPAASMQERISVVVPVLPHISNHTDLDPLRLHPQVDFEYIGPQQRLPGADLLILPGSKNVIGDLRFLRQQGWHRDIARHLRYGGKLIGICGGLQMLGRQVRDPLGIESNVTQEVGLGWLEIATELGPEKRLVNREGTLFDTNITVSGYEIHAGISDGVGMQRPVVRYIDEDGWLCSDGAISPDDQVMGSYWHGLFEQPQALAALLEWAGLSSRIEFDFPALRLREIDRLADAVEAALSPELIRALRS